MAAPILIPPKKKRKNIYGKSALDILHTISYTCNFKKKMLFTAITKLFQ